MPLRPFITLQSMSPRALRVPNWHCSSQKRQAYARGEGKGYWRTLQAVCLEPKVYSKHKPPTETTRAVITRSDQSFCLALAEISVIAERSK